MRQFEMTTAASDAEFAVDNYVTLTCL